MSRFTLAPLVCCALLAGCDRSSPTEPNHGLSVYLQSACVPSGTLVSCRAFLSGVPGYNEVTSQATWLESDPSLGGFSAPGVFAPTARGEVAIWVRFQRWEEGVHSSFLVDPAASAQRLYFLSGTVFDDATNATIAGADLEMLEGYAKGEHVLTNQYGVYQFEKIIAGESISVRVSKSGYVPQLQTYRP